MNLTDNKEYLMKAMQQQAMQQQMAAQQQAQGGQAPTAAPVAQDLAGQAAQMQNTAQQQSMQNAEMQKGQQLMNAAGQTGGSSSMPALGLALALRKDKKKEEELANREASQWNQRPAMEYYSKGLNPMDIVSDQ